MSGLNNIKSEIRDPSHARDLEYYYNDGNTVFLVGGYLFKLQASLLTSHSSDFFEKCGAPPGYSPAASHSSEESIGTNDQNPISIPDIHARQFRNLLFVLLGTPVDPDYVSLVADAKDVRKHTQPTFVRYLDIASLSQRFGMVKLEAWARTQLTLLLQSPDRLVDGPWDKDTLLQIKSYADITGNQNLIRQTTPFVRLVISLSTHPSAMAQPPSSLNLASCLGACVELYKDPTIQASNPALFGFVFIAILSLGHRSPVWANKLTRNDRTTLYTAQAHLISLGDNLSTSGWLRHPRQIFQAMRITICKACSQQFDLLWAASFGKCGQLTSTTALEDISKLVELPQHRQILSRPSWSLCDSNCKTHVLDEIDACTELLFEDLASKHDYFSSVA